MTISIPDRPSVGAVLAAAVLLLTSPLSGQSTVSWGSIRGQLQDGAGLPVAGAFVSLEGATGTTISDSDGRYQLERVPPGSYTIVVTAGGYLTESAEVLVRPGVETARSFQLVRLLALQGVEVEAARRGGSVTRAPDVLEGLVLAGTGSTVIQLEGLAANLAEKNARQVFSRVPGAFVYDMDGSGNQVNVSTRGLDPHRSWELNVRQDGVLLNSDLYGYPASHYSPPMEAVERLEVIRGTAALQYGSQYGGLLNYVTKRPATDGAVGGESVNTVGSFGLRSTFNAVGGNAGRLTYYAYMNERRSDGYRRGSSSDFEAQFLSATFQATPRLSVGGQIGRTAYVYQLPGPLTDAMFREDPRQATRTRNYYQPDITVPAIRVDWRGADGTHLNTTVSAILGPRNSVQFIGFADQPDLPDPRTGEYAPRQVDVDRFRSLNFEARLVRPWSIGGLEQSLAVGTALLHNRMTRRQQGQGTTGDDFDLRVVGDGFRRDILYETQNAAVYLENLFRVRPNWTIVPGARVEMGETRMTGQLAYYDPADTPRAFQHRFPLFGIRTSYELVSGGEFYAGWSQAYRPQILADVLPANALERTDPNLKDSRGWTAEAGIRGTLARVVGYDISVFELHVGDRLGTTLRADPDGTSYLYRTNLGSSRTRGIETSLEVWLLQRRGLAVWAHTASSYFDGEYTRGTAIVGGRNVDITGNDLESVPTWITRNGLSVEAGRGSVNLLVSYTSSSFADPLNTREPSPNGAVGLVPAYTLTDINGGFEATDWLRLRAGISNLFDRQYFTKRPEFYPGPGIWSGDGRSLQLTVELRHWP